MNQSFSLWSLGLLELAGVRTEIKLSAAFGRELNETRNVDALCRQIQPTLQGTDTFEADLAHRHTLAQEPRSQKSFLVPGVETIMLRNQLTLFRKLNDRTPRHSFDEIENKTDDLFKLMLIGSPCLTPQGR